MGHAAEPGEQVPAPSHELVVSSAELQLAVPQDVPAAYLRHAPEPLQKPSLPQLAAPASVHSESGSVPPAIVPQVPLAPPPFLAVVQAWHEPEQALSQYTPSAQKLLVHCPVAVHVDPFARLATHAPPLQKLPLAHCVSSVQLV